MRLGDLLVQASQLQAFPLALTFETQQSLTLRLFLTAMAHRNRIRNRAIRCTQGQAPPKGSGSEEL